MRRARKLKKMKVLILAVIVIVIVALIIALLVNKFSGKGGENENKPVETENSIIYNLPDTVYNGMEVTNVELEYLKTNNQTMVTMIIKNTTGALSERQAFNVYFYDANDVELLNAQTTIEEMEPDVESSTSIILTGDFTSITRVELRK